MSPSRLPTQRSLLEQLTDLAVVANQKGMYDAADYLWAKVEDIKNAAWMEERAAKHRKNRCDWPEFPCTCKEKP